MKSSSSNCFVMFTCVYAGLNVEVDRILEIACIITNGSLTKSVEVWTYRSVLFCFTCERTKKQLFGT